MLTIREVTSASRAKDYYAVADYYSDGQETVGCWVGDLAAEWGLTGTVTQEAFDRLCEHRHPISGGALTARSNAYFRVGYDFTVSHNKSASIVRAFADEATAHDMDWARDDAMTFMLREIEKDMQCRERRDGADYDVTTGNMAAALFPHTTARPVPGFVPDMDDHTHTLIFSCTRSPDGRILAGQFGGLKRDGEYYSALYDSRYVANLEKLGFAVTKTGGKGWEISGISPELIFKFSKRQQQIEAEAKRLGITDPEEKGELAAKTRSGKQKELTRSELREAWDAQLSDDDREALAAVYRREAEGGPKVSAGEAVAYAREHCFYREAVVSEKELVRVALLYGLGDVTADQVRAEMPGQGVVLAERGGRLMATTQQAYAMERFYVNHAKNGRGEVMPPGLPEGLGRGILDDEQWACVGSLMTSCDKVQLVDSAAGVGKSTMLSVYARGMAMAGRHVTYLATTTPAVDVLRQDGFEAETLAKFLSTDAMAVRGGTVVVDEASFIGLKDAYRLFKVCKEKDISLVMLGDSRQHSSVGSGGGAVMRTLTEYAHIEPIRITQIKRQQNPHHLEAVGHLSEGRVLDAFDILDQKLGWVHEIQDGDERYAAMAAAYLDGLKSGLKWEEILVSSPTHAEGERATQAIRSLLKQTKIKGKALLGKKDHEFTRWVSADLSDAEKGDARNYRPGRVDMVRFFQHARGHPAGSRVLLGEGGPASLPLDEGSKFQAYRQESVKFAVGDILRFTANGSTLDGHRIRNGSAYKIAGFTARGIRLSNGWLVARDFGHWRHGIETSHSSQGRTVKLSLSAVSSYSFAAANAQQGYVDASRARVKALTFTDDKEGLRAAIQRDSLKLAAHDLLDAQAAVYDLQRYRERHRRRHNHLVRLRADAAARSPQAPEPPGPHLDQLTQRERGFGHGR
jgi:conjugative relaxase-like TrwC/TraI family protein